MNKFRNAKIIAMLGLGTLTIGTATTFAGSTTSNTARLAIEGRQAHGGSGQLVGSGQNRGNRCEQFFSTGLTDTQKTAAKALQETYRTDLKSFFDTNSGALEDSTVVAALATLKSTYIANMTSYIDSTKLEAFSKMINEQSMDNGGRRDKMGQNDGDEDSATGSTQNGKWGKDDKTETTTTVKSATVQNIEKVIDKKLAALSDDDARISWLNALNAKVVSLSAKVTSTKSKTLLSSIQDVINEKLDEINGTSLDDEILEGLME